MLTQILEAINVCEKEGDIAVHVFDGEVMCVRRFMFTVAIVCGCDRDGYERRYCYNGVGEALGSFVEWNGVGHPPGDWLKLKGKYRGMHVNHRKDQLDPDGTPWRLDVAGRRVGRRNIRMGDRRNQTPTEPEPDNRGRVDEV